MVSRWSNEKKTAHRFEGLKDTGIFLNIVAYFLKIIIVEVEKQPLQVVPAHNNRKCITIRDFYSSCYGAAVGYVYTMTPSENRKVWVKCLLRVQLWTGNQRATEAEEFSLLRFVTRKRILKTPQMSNHCWQRLPSKD
jgi:hypothetical protein